jgi:NAD(P)-dependent dehydrogenase (short-subunit alcohol dehydrogenase family)
VRVNAILPGAVETDMHNAMNDTADKQTFMTNLHELVAENIAPTGAPAPACGSALKVRVRLRRRPGVARAAMKPTVAPASTTYKEVCIGQDNLRRRKPLPRIGIRC